ncbi:MAG: hypothetical protein IPJ81_05775 [Chitinophagaceae bacterium]|nr:hypothetical protein [Chitinophagaceae bacterium]
MKIQNSLELKSAILRLEKSSDKQKQELIHSFCETYESLKPRNLIHSAVTRITKSPKLSSTLLTGAGTVITSIATVFLPKKLLLGISGKVIKGLAGLIINRGVNKISAHSGEIKKGGSNLFKRLVNKFTH